jgi:hypothetical protein
VKNFKLFFIANTFLKLKIKIGKSDEMTSEQVRYCVVMWW